MPFIIPAAIIVTSSAPGNVLSSVSLRQQAVPAKKNKTLFNHCPLCFSSSAVCGGHASLFLSFPGVLSVQVTPQRATTERSQTKHFLWMFKFKQVFNIDKSLVKSTPLLSILWFETCNQYNLINYSCPGACWENQHNKAKSILNYIFHFIHLKFIYGFDYWKRRS